MAKGKNKSKGKKGKGTKRAALGAGLLGGAATLVGTKAAGEVVKEAVQYGARKALGLHKADVAAEKDLGFQILQRLADDADQPTCVMPLATELKVGLLKLLDAVKALRGARLIKYGEGRRVITLTPLGQEALATLTPPEKEGDEDADKDGSAAVREDQGVGKSEDGSATGSQEE